MAPRSSEGLSRVLGVDHCSAWLSDRVSIGRSSLTPTDDSNRYFESENASFDVVRKLAVTTGLSVGLYSAAALAVSESLGDLVQYGVDAVRLGFRQGGHVYQFSDYLDSVDKTSAVESWAYVVAGISEEALQKELDIYNASTVSQAFYRA